MRYTITFLASALAAVAAAGCAHEKLDTIPRGWTHHRDASPDERLVLHVALQDQNRDAFEQRVYDLSTPGHQAYGEFMEGHEVDSFLQPLKDARNAVTDWIKSHNISHVVSDDEWVTLRTTVGEANEMLKTKFAWFHNKQRGETSLRTLGYYLPEHLTRHVDFLHPTIKFPSTSALRSTIHKSAKPKIGASEAVTTYKAWKQSVGSSSVTPPSAVCNKAVTPQCILDLYNVHYGADASNGNTIAYASFLNESARYSDLTLFETEIAQYAMGQNFTVKTFAGGVNDQSSMDDATEANLDNQYIIGVGYPSPVTEYITPGCGPLVPDPNEPAGACDNEPYMTFLNGILKLPNSKLPQTLSVSYGEDEQAWPEKMAKKVCSNFAKLGARGVSVMFASGDSGPGAICENNDGSKSVFTPAFPAGCPFVTTVGATQGVGPETAADFSGGGFSNYFAQPSYQKSAVAAYLKKLGNKQSAYFTSTGRAYPDVSAQGVDFLIVSSAAVEPVDGTSCASPTFASVIGLLNSARISSGKKPLGFLNPFLYQHSSAFTDIVGGGSTGCASGTAIPYASWNATVGWDPATGLGTPLFNKLLKIAAPGVKNTGGPV